MTEENTQPKTFGWVAGVPVGLQEHPDNLRAIEERQKLYQQQESQNPSEPS